MNHQVRTKAHGINFMFQASSSVHEGIIFYIECGVTNLSMWLPADEARAIAHAITLAADEAQMQPEAEELTP